MATSLPVLRGEMGDTEFFAAIMSLGELARLVHYKEELPEWREAEPPPELRQQRRLNWSRVRNEIVPYLTQIPDHFFSAITVEVMRPGETDHRLRFEKNPEWTKTTGVEAGVVIFDGTEYLSPVDGQHRLAAIKEAAKENPILLKENISVLLLAHKNNRRSQQLFSDLNRHAKPTTKTINILFEHRGFFERVSKEVASHSHPLRNRVNLETNTLAQKSPHIITLGVLYECVLSLLQGRDPYGPEASDPQILARGTEEVVEVFDEVVIPGLPEFDRVFMGEIRPYDYRKKYIATHSAGWQAIARAVRAAKVQQPQSWRSVVSQGFRRINWEITNPEWEGTAVQAGMVLNRRQNIARVSAQLKVLLGLKPDTAESQELDRALADLGRSAVLPQAPAAAT